ncbi:37S RIBOSOMAL PROTEIN SWS2 MITOCHONDRIAL [Salix koriyanagi]|uniref:37S RIBOSOMAL PROTEIN SWS2 MITOCHONDRIAL n=2 Tax=Salix TaxID=40685 RepID=A0A9Q0P501_9ROSI|nr:37S RIBOSOMAL PROTEIN SWS2 MITOCHONDRIAL [Salix koriyanagi]
MDIKEAGKDLKDKIVKARANTNRVIISIYTESPRKRIQQKHNPTTKKTTKTRGYDRRAQLLSYVSELRCAGSEPMERSRRDVRCKSKKWKWSTATIRESFLRMTQQKERQWGYERIVTEENGEPDHLQESSNCSSAEEIDEHAQGINMWITVQQGVPRDKQSSNLCRSLPSVWSPRNSSSRKIKIHLTSSVWQTETKMVQTLALPVLPSLSSICSGLKNTSLSNSISLPISNPPKVYSLSIQCARVGGVEIPNSKRVEYSLQYIHGIGRSVARQILSDLTMENKITKDLSEEELIILRDEVSKYMIEGDLRRFNALNIRRLKEIQCYRGIRHIQGLPCRGQRTKNNCRTLKGKRVSIPGKKKAPR